MMLNIDLYLTFVPGSQNPADTPRSLCLQNAKLSPSMWEIVQDSFGGERGYSIDLMAHPSNVQVDLADNPLPFFSETPLPVAFG